MEIYEYLTNVFNERLGMDYNVVYNNNDNVKWDDILKDNMIHAVYGVDGGEMGKISSAYSESKTIHIDFAIPTDNDTFDKAVLNIDNTFKELNEALLSTGKIDVQIEYNYRTDASYLGAINGKKYCLVTVYLNVLLTDTLVFSNEVNIEIDNVLLEGVISATPTTKHENDKAIVGGQVKGYNNNIQYSLTVDLVIKRENNLIAKLLYEKHQNKKYSVSVDYNIAYVEDGANKDIIDTYEMHLTECTINAIMGDVLKLRLAFEEV